MSTKNLLVICDSVKMVEELARVLADKVEGCMLYVDCSNSIHPADIMRKVQNAIRVVPVRSPDGLANVGKVIIQTDCETDLTRYKDAFPDVSFDEW